MLEAIRQAADTYAQHLTAAANAGAQVDPEAQITTPLSNFITAFCEATDLGTVVLLREAHLDGVKPDFDVRLDDRQCGWIELKKPGHDLEGSKWRGREKRQWQLLAELDPLIVTDGYCARIYRVGVPVGGQDGIVELPTQGSENWAPQPLENLLRLFASVSPTPIKRVSQLARRLAPLTRMLRDEIAAGLTSNTPLPAVRQAKTLWAVHVHERVSDEDFPNDLAQVIAYSLAIASMQADVDVNNDSHISLQEAQDALREHHSVLAAALGPALSVPGLYDALATKIGAIERLVSGVDRASITRSNDPRGEPWLWFYEDFLEIYDPEARKKAGVYYTPAEVVQMQVRHVDYILREIFGRRLGFGDKQVVTLDPATGSGTYPLTVLDRAAETALAQRGLAGPAQVAKNLTDNLLAFELLPGPYAVAHLRIGQRLAEMEGALTVRKSPRVYLTDTLDDPEREIPTLNVWGDPELLAAERRHAQQVKREQPVTVVLGNPPYKRRDQESGGGWVVHATTGRSLYDDVTEAAKQAGVIFSAMRSVYDDYLYFWRWGLWKAFEQDPAKSAVVSFITSSSWLSGPAFIGLRRIAREYADEMWIVDLGGQGRGAITEQNVFQIQTPVAIVTLYRKGKRKAQPATVSYRRISGTAVEKLSALESVASPPEDPNGWTVVTTSSASDRLIPETGDQAWFAMPALSDLFPWQQPGTILSRAWPVAPSQDVLWQRWHELLSSPIASEREDKFVQAKTGRNIHTKVEGLPTIASLPSDAAAPNTARYAFRAFDRQWTFEDPRVAKTESPSLWQSRSDAQIFLTSLLTNQLGAGVGMIATVDVPDFHHFRGSNGGKDVIPLYRDAAASQPNLPAGLLDMLSERLQIPVTVEHLAAYVYEIMAHPGYQQTFATELETPGPRVPITADPQLFQQAVEAGSHLLWLQTWANRLRGPGSGSQVPLVVSWLSAVTAVPANSDSISYDPCRRELRVGDGTIAGVRPEVWEFSVAGFPVVQRWLQSRTAKGVGRSSSPTYATPLDLIRPTVWEDDWNDELLELISVLTLTIDGYTDQANLLNSICASELIPASDLPMPSAAERKVPRTIR